MEQAPSFEQAWSALQPVHRTCIDQAVASFSARGLPVGAAIARDGQIVSLGRNRVYDPAGGDDVIQGSPLAHAEMNAIAAISRDTDLATCELWSTHFPCSMCTSAIRFTGVGAMHYIASDPSDPASIDGDELAPVWSIALNVLFLHNVVLVGGVDDPMVEDNRNREPETTGFVLELVRTERLTRLSRAGAPEVLSEIWADLADAARTRAHRSSTPRPAG